MHSRSVDWTPPDPPLQADGIFLRLFERKDAARVVEACADPQITRFTFMAEGTCTSDAVEWIDRSNELWPKGVSRFAIADATDDAVLGQVGLSFSPLLCSAEAFYWVIADQRRRRLASTALGLVVDWAFDKGVERLCLLVHTDNAASNGLAARMGFSREGVLRAYEPVKGRRPDLVSWSLLPSENRPWRDAA